jgi:hypothetical protein
VGLTQPFGENLTLRPVSGWKKGSHLAHRLTFVNVLLWPLPGIAAPAAINES